MRKFLPGWLITLMLMAASLMIGLLIPNITITFDDAQPESLITPITQVAQVNTAAPTPSPQPPASATPEPTITNTLKPPPTLEPPTATPPPSATPSVTPTITLQVSINIPGIRGVETTAEAAEACEPREDWVLRYEVAFNDALETIASQFGTTAAELAEGNCITDLDLIRVGQVLRVPGDPPPPPGTESICRNYILFTPIDYAWELGPGGQIVFHWHGPAARRNLIRVYPPDNYLDQEAYWFDQVLADEEGTEDDEDDIDNTREAQQQREEDKWPKEWNIDIRQNETVSMDEFPYEGMYTWWVIPLDINFQQICPSGGPWYFHKFPEPTPVPSVSNADPEPANPAAPGFP